MKITIKNTYKNENDKIQIEIRNRSKNKKTYRNKIK